ncbi:small multidrug resistance protein [Chondrocystis sp. NIES-4102]|nr:small multidrug resistance protein [Chondrocystis sp. NIES-4102]
MKMVIDKNVLFLFLAIISEIVATTCLKMTNGSFKSIYLIGVTTGYVLAFGFLSIAIKTIDISIAYAIWSGLGIIGISIIGILLFNESISFLKVVFIGAILIGVVGLNVLESH